jgi:KaiC/GvpD/RAD55 family RecA-like ATPase
MAIEIRKAERFKAKLRLALAGPSGAGKTMSSLKLAKGVAGDKGRVIMIDTERGSGDLYANLFPYDIISLQAPFKPERYIEAIHAAEKAGYDVIIIDSLSHAWSDDGGILDQADKMESAGKNRFTMWADLTPQHRQFVNAMLNSPAHLVVTVRSKQEYALMRDEKSGKNIVQKLGMGIVQRDGLEYEFTVFMDIDQNHIAHASKDRTDLFRNEMFMIDEKTGVRLLEWLNDGEDRELMEAKKNIVRRLRFLGADQSPITEVKRLTQLDLVPENFDEIIARLEVLCGDKREADKAKPSTPPEPQNAPPAPVTAPVAPEPEKAPEVAVSQEPAKESGVSAATEIQYERTGYPDEEINPEDIPF